MALLKEDLTQTKVKVRRREEGLCTHVYIYIGTNNRPPPPTPEKPPLHQPNTKHSPKKTTQVEEKRAATEQLLAEMGVQRADAEVQRAAATVEADKAREC